MGSRQGEKDQSIPRCWIPGCTARAELHVRLQDDDSDRMVDVDFCEFHYGLFRLLNQTMRGRELPAASEVP